VWSESRVAEIKACIEYDEISVPRSDCNLDAVQIYIDVPNLNGVVDLYHLVQ
jgi:hypothetical protein